MMQNERLIDVIKGCLYGVAIGDSLGATVEFMTADQIVSQYGKLTEIIGGGHCSWKPGTGTDDTAMTLAIADGLLDCELDGDPVEMVGKRFVDWYRTGPKDIGHTCRLVIGLASDQGMIAKPTREQWFAASRQAHQYLCGKSGGNGTLMRTAPVALLTNGERMRDLAMDLSDMTHYDPDAGTACLIYCAIISRLIRGYIPKEAVYTSVWRTEYQDIENMQPNSTGYVKDTFRTALWGLTRTNTFEDALVEVVNLGGDADTAGAVVGGLAGAVYGFSMIPDRWVNALDKGLKTHLDAIVDAAVAFWQARK